MISEPLKYIEDFAKAGADIITFHIESDSPAEETVDKILACGCKAGVSVKPATPHRSFSLSRQALDGACDDGRAGLRRAVLYARDDGKSQSPAP